MSEDSPSQLSFELLVKRRESATRGTPPGMDDLKWVSNAVTQIYGARDAVMIDTFLSEAQTLELVDWIKSKGRRLTTIYVTHGHPDHFFGLKALLDHFPNARAIAS